MKNIFKPILYILVSLQIMVAFTACIHSKPISNRTMDFEQGITILANNIADQLDKSSFSNMLDMAIINPLTNQKQMKKIVIDPFIDAESGYPVKVNSLIKELFAKEIGKRFNVIGILDPESLEASEYILNGMVTLEDKAGGHEKVYKAFATVFEKTTGKVLASSSVYFNTFDTTPMDIYKDSPVFLKGKNYEDHVSSVRQKPDSIITKGYSDRLVTKAILGKGDTLYEKHDYKKSLAYYNQVAGGQNDQDLEVLNGLFTNLVKQQKLTEAETIYAKLLKKSITETSQITSKIIFAPSSTAPLESNISLYNIYIRQIANLVAVTPSCKIQIIGHSSRSGSEGFNDKLSLQRAEWIQNQMIAYAPLVKGKSETFGRGFKENIVGSGKDDITDAIDRRVEFKFAQGNNLNVMTKEEKINPLNDQQATASNVSLNKPLEVEDIEYYLKNKVSNKVIVSRIAERGVNFHLDSKTKSRLKKAKADEQVFKAIDKANATAKRRN